MSAVKDPWLVQYDYSQVEVRIMAIFSRDENLLDYFRKGLDVHTHVACKIFKKAPEDIEKEERVITKRTVFGVCYCQGPQGLADELGITFEEADAFMNQFFGEFPKVHEWMEKTKKLAMKTGEVKNLFGTVRRLPNAMIPNPKDSLRNEALRQAVNTPIQSTAALVLKDRMGALWRWMRLERKLKARMLLTVHDSILNTVPDNEMRIFVPEAKKILDTNNFSWADIPILTDCEIGRRWGQMEKLKDRDIQAIADGQDPEEIYRKLLDAKKAA